MNKETVISIDGSWGEGGGQMLRSALTLSMLTGMAFEIKNIRAKRPKSGLLRQHLTAVQAATAISHAKVSGAELGSLSLSFAPADICGGNYEFAIGTAGSCILVLQTILPALWFANAPSTVLVSGGTHNKAAPPADFLMQTWAPLMHQMGAEQTLELRRYGFYPAGGGQILAQVTPCKVLTPLHLHERGKHCVTEGEVCISALPEDIAQREIEQLEKRLPHALLKLNTLSSRRAGPGNVVLLTTRFEQLALVFCGFAEKGVKAQDIADRVVLQAQTYCENQAVADEYLADQLLLPMALAGAGSYTAQTLSSHFKTNVEIISKFLPIEIEATPHAYGWLVEVRS